MMSGFDLEDVRRFAESVQNYKMQFIGAKEVAEYMGCSVTEARNIMRREDFPTVKIGKAFKVMRSALVEWAKERRAV